MSESEKRALMQLSYVGVIPTKPVLNFIETLCITTLEYQITALEYQAASVPLVTTRVGGYLKWPDMARRNWRRKISLTLTITSTFIEYLQECQP